MVAFSVEPIGRDNGCLLPSMPMSRATAGVLTEVPIDIIATGAGPDHGDLGPHAADTSRFVIRAIA